MSQNLILVHHYRVGDWLKVTNWEDLQINIRELGDSGSGANDLMETNLAKYRAMFVEKEAACTEAGETIQGRVPVEHGTVVTQQQHKTKYNTKKRLCSRTLDYKNWR